MTPASNSPAPPDSQVNAGGPTSTGAWSSTNSYADVTERLFREFEPVHGLPMITQIMRRCRADLRGAPGDAMLDTLERMARQRISSLPTLTFPATDQDEELTTPPIG